MGESKVQQRVYHGTGSGEINTFDPGKRLASGDPSPPDHSTGYYFTDDPELASFYAGKGTRSKPRPAVIPAFLNLKNPFRWDDKSQTVIRYLEEGKPLPRGLQERVQARTGLGPGPREFVEPEDVERLADAIRDELQAMGHDGITVNLPGGGHEYVAFKPTQIKSATGNRGTFDTKNPDIRMAHGGPVPLPAGGFVLKAEAVRRLGSDIHRLGPDARQVRGPGGPTADQIPAVLPGGQPARLSDSEVVLGPRTVERWGVGELQRLNRGFADGGDVTPEWTPRARAGLEGAGETMGGGGQAMGGVGELVRAFAEMRQSLTEVVREMRELKDELRRGKSSGRGGYEPLM